MLSARTDFVDWRLKIEGLVEKPAEYSLAELRAMPSRTQITRHDCVEGWSCIGKWKGVPLAPCARASRSSSPQARYIVFHCADELGKTLDGSGIYYESSGWRTLPSADDPRLRAERRSVPVDGAPLRSVERQLGYKMAKYLMRIEAVESFASIVGGRGGFGKTWAMSGTLASDFLGSNT